MSPTHNTCDCPVPPGGRAVCAANQLAICRVVNGVAEMECVNPPKGLIGNRLRNWALHHITGRPLELGARINFIDEDTLKSGTYSEGGVLVRFSLPNQQKTTGLRKTVLVEQVARAAGITKSQASVALGQLISSVSDALREGDKVTLQGFGTFSVVSRGARTGRNPRESQPVKIAAKKVAKFKPGKKLADEVNAKGGKKKK